MCTTNFSTNFIKHSKPPFHFCWSMRYCKNKNESNLPTEVRMSWFKEMRRTGIGGKKMVWLFSHHVFVLKIQLKTIRLKWVIISSLRFNLFRDLISDYPLISTTPFSQLPLSEIIHSIWSRENYLNNYRSPCLIDDLTHTYKIEDI